MKVYSVFYMYIKMKVSSVGNGILLIPRRNLSNELEVMPICFAFSVIFIEC